jgi:cytochrome c biogenesis protein CcmG/thiol:disulfide interchange protein DsbE
MSSEKWQTPEQTEQPPSEPGPLPKPSLRLTGVFIGVIAIGLVLAWVLGDSSPERAEIGRPAPDFTVPMIGGGSFTLSDQIDAEDRPVVLNLWASWCLPCRTEVPEISSFSEANPGVKVIGVAVEDTEDAAIEFAEEFAPAYDLAIGDGAFEQAYPRLGLPITYIIDADGVVIEAFNGIINEATLQDLVSDLVG